LERVRPGLPVLYPAGGKSIARWRDQWVGVVLIEVLLYETMRAESIRRGHGASGALQLGTHSG
jgi:hypothetical protein